MILKKQEQYLLTRLLENVGVIFFIAFLAIYLITIFVELRVELTIDSGFAFFYYCFLRLIAFFPYFLHIFVLLAGAITIYVLNKNNELLVMMMSGISSIKVGVIYACVLVIFCGLLLLPINMYGGKILLISERMKSGSWQSSTDLQSVWLKEKGKYIYVSSLKNSSVIEDISIVYIDDKDRPKKIINIKDALYNKDGNNELSWSEDNFNAYSFDTQGNLYLDPTIKDIDLEIDQEIIYLASINKIYMDGFELHKYYKYLQENGIYNSSYEIIFKEFFTKYLILFGVFLFSLSFLFRQARTQNLNLSMSQAIGSTIGIYYGYVYLELLNKNIGYAWWLNSVIMIILLVILNYIVWSKQKKLNN